MDVASPTELSAQLAAAADRIARIGATATDWRHGDDLTHLLRGELEQLRALRSTFDVPVLDVGEDS